MSSYCIEKRKNQLKSSLFLLRHPVQSRIMRSKHLSFRTLYFDSGSYSPTVLFTLTYILCISIIDLYLLVLYCVSFPFPHIQGLNVIPRRMKGFWNISFGHHLGRTYLLRTFPKNPFHLCVSYGVRSLVYLYRSSFYAMF